MENKTTYSITDLTNKLKLPRSTINDWLIRYEQYIEFSKRGKRKVFFDSSLSVLQEIAELRTLGKSSYEIEQALAQRHPVQAELASNEIKPHSSENQLLPNLKNQNEELTGLLGNQLEELSQYITAAQQQNQQVTKKIGHWYLTALLLFALLTAAFAVAIVKIRQVLEEQKMQSAHNQTIITAQNRTVTNGLNINKQVLQNTRQTLSKQTIELNRIGVELNRNSADYQKNITELKAGLQEQRKNFAAMLSRARHDAAQEKSAELAKQRDAFAKQQLDKLRKLEQLAIELKRRQAEIEILKLRLTAKQASLDEVMRRSKKSTTPNPTQQPLEK